MWSLLLIGSVLANAVSGQSPTVCNANNCLRAVRATNAFPFASSATADCSSFLRRTVTPCPSTSTSTITVTLTASPTVLTKTSTFIRTDVNTLSQTVTSTQTILDTLTLTTSTPVTDTIFSTFTTTVTAAAGQKRAVSIKPLPVIPDSLGLQKRVTAGTTCTARTSTPSNVPRYASACSGTVKYSSACSCAGVTASATTLSASTVVTTSTSTVFVTPTSTIPTTLTNAVTSLVTVTQTVPATLQTTVATIVESSFITQTTQVDVPTTIVVPPPVCSTYKFVATSGQYADQFLTGGEPDPSAISYGFVEFDANQNLANAKVFTLRADGRVYGGGNTYGWVTKSGERYYILQMTDSSFASYGSQIQSITCSITPGGTTYPGAAGSLSCSASGQPFVLETCPELGNDLIQEPSTSFGCTPLNLAAVASC